MLGEIIFESKGKIIGQRVKSVEDGIPNWRSQPQDREQLEEISK
jgi:hypothetical protein